MIVWSETTSPWGCQAKEGLLSLSELMCERKSGESANRVVVEGEEKYVEK